MAYLRPLVGVSAADLAQLNMGQANSTVVKAFFRLVDRRSAFYPTLPKTWSFDPQFFPLWEQEPIEVTRRFAKGKHVLDKDLLFFPTALPPWTLLVVKPKRKEILTFDPCSTLRTTELGVLLDFMERVSRCEGKPFVREEWRTLDTPVGCPRAEPQHGALFVCTLGDKLARDAGVVGLTIGWREAKFVIHRTLVNGRFDREDFSELDLPLGSPTSSPPPTIPGDRSVTPTVTDMELGTEIQLFLDTIENPSTSTAPICPAVSSPVLRLDCSDVELEGPTVLQEPPAGVVGGPQVEEDEPPARVVDKDLLVVSTVSSPHRQHRHRPEDKRPHRENRRPRRGDRRPDQRRQATTSSSRPERGSKPTGSAPSAAVPRPTSSTERGRHRPRDDHPRGSRTNPVQKRRTSNPRPAEVRPEVRRPRYLPPEAIIMTVPRRAPQQQQSSETPRQGAARPAETAVRPAEAVARPAEPAAGRAGPSTAQGSADPPGRAPPRLRVESLLQRPPRQQGGHRAGILPKELLEIPDSVLRRLGATYDRQSSEQRKNKRWRIFVAPGHYIRVRPNQILRLLESRGLLPRDRPSSRRR